MYGGPADAFLLAGQSGFEASLRSLAFALWAIVLPGMAVTRWLGRREVGFILPLGVASAVSVGWATHEVDLPVLFPLLCGALACAAVPAIRRGSWEFERALVAPAILLVTLLAVLRTGGMQEGSFVFETPGMEDNAFHAGVAFELARGGAPEVPGLAGVPLRYHFGQDLIRANAFVWGGVHPWMSLVRFEPVLGGLALVGVAGLTVRALGGGPRARALAPWAVFASDASFIPAFAKPDDYWVDGTRMNFALAVLLGNAGAPLAVALVLGLFVLFERDSARSRAIALAGGLVLALLKSFAAAQLAAAALGAALFVRSVPCLLAGLSATAGLVALSAGATEGTSVTLAPFEIARAFAERWHLPAGAPGVALWLTLGIGARWLALPAFVSALRGPAPARGVAFFSAAGLIAGSLFQIRLAETLHSEAVFNDAAYFLEQGAWPLWLFLSLWVGDARRVLARALSVLLLALPSTLQAAWRFATSPRVAAPPELLRALEPLARADLRDSVVLQARRSELPPLPIALLGLRVPVSNFFGYLPRYLEGESIARREAAARTVFTTEDPLAARAAILDLAVTHVLIVDGHDPRFPTPGILVPLVSTDAATLFSATRPSHRAPEM